MTKERWRSLVGSAGPVPFGDVEISQISLGNTVRIRFADETRLDIETPFQVESAASKDVVDPEGEPAALSPVLPLIHDRIVTAWVDQHATLTLTTQGGLRLQINSDERYEAWQLTAVDGEFIFARPGDAGLAWVSPRG